MGRALAYIRVSMEGGRGDDMVSPQIQLDAITRHCEQQGHTIIETLEDIDLSGKFWKGRQIEHAVQRIEAREADVLVVWKLSRLSRDRKDWALAVDRVEGAGGRLESATEPLDTTTSSGRFARGVLVELAAFESERIGESWREAHAQRVKRGLPHHGRPQFGYTYTREGGYEVDPVTGPVLRSLYMDYLAGSSLGDLAVRSGTYGGPKAIDGLRYTLDNGFGAGKIRYREELLAGAHEGVITDEEFEAFRRARRKRSGSQRSEAAEFALSGLAVCWCGQRMWGNTRQMNGRDASRYLCAVRGADGTYGHTNSVSVRVAEAAVEEWLSGLAEEFGREGAKARPPAKRQAGARRALEASLSKAVGRLDALTMKYLDGDIAKDVHDRLEASLRAEVKSLEERIEDELEKEAAPSMKALAPDLLAHWGVMPAKNRREVLKRLVKRIEVGKVGSEPRVRIVPVWE